MLLASWPGDKRRQAIRATPSSAGFPLMPGVLQSIAGLPQTELVAYGLDRRVQSLTLDGGLASDDKLVLRAEHSSTNHCTNRTSV